MMRAHLTANNSESGQGTLELALSLPLFVLLILGSAEIANLAWSSVQINNAARAGAAYASLSRANAGASNLANIQTAAQNEAPKLITSPATQVTSNQVCYCVDSGTPITTDPGCATTTLTSCPSPDNIQVAVQVNVSVPVSPLIHYPGLPATYTVKAQATVGVVQ
jgi:Flp pilus assembly protein TadG